MRQRLKQDLLTSQAEEEAKMKCSFCRNIIEPGTGTMYVKNDGKILNFCSMKCEKNTLKLKRTARHIKWTKAFEKGAEK